MTPESTEASKKGFYVECNLEHGLNYRVDNKTVYILETKEKHMPDIIFSSE